jgi:uncharacterized membrane protein
MKKYLFVILFVLAFLERTVFDLGPNFELITAALILSSFYLGSKKAFWLTFLILATTDTIIGNTSIFLFTWSGFLLPALIVGKFFNEKKSNKIRGVLFGTSLGIGSNLFFFLWTNFGVWLLDQWGMYPKTLPGLIMSYLNGLPFLKYQLTSTLIFVPVGFIAIEITKYFIKRLKPNLLVEKI